MLLTHLSRISSEKTWPETSGFPDRLERVVHVHRYTQFTVHRYTQFTTFLPAHSRCFAKLPFPPLPYPPVVVSDLYYSEALRSLPEAGRAQPQVAQDPPQLLRPLLARRLQLLQVEHRQVRRDGRPVLDHFQPLTALGQTRRRDSQGPLGPAHTY